MAITIMIIESRQKEPLYKQRERNNCQYRLYLKYHNGAMAKGIQTGEELESRAARNSSRFFYGRQMEIDGERNTEKMRERERQASTKSVRKRPQSSPRSRRLNAASTMNDSRTKITQHQFINEHIYIEGKKQRKKK